MIRHRECIERITPYVPGRSIDEVRAEFGLERVVKLASNENPLGPSPRAMAAAVEAVGEVHRYPDGACRRLTARLARHLDVPEDCIVVGNGSDEVLKMIGEAFLHPDDEVVYADPTFSEYAYVARLMGAVERSVPLAEDETHDLEAMAQAVTERTKIAFVCNPNNPTGTIVTHAALERFLAALPPHCLLVIDEAYFEYVDHPDYPAALDWVREGRNVVVLRTFSKMYGLAGLRVGYGVAPPAIAANLRRVKEPFNVNSLAQVAATAALDDEEHVQKSRALNARERARLTEELRKLGFHVVDSQANFVWVRLPGAAKPLYEALLRDGVIVRGGDAFGRPKHLRITVGTEAENDMLLQSLQRLGSSVERSAL